MPKRGVLNAQIPFAGLASVRKMGKDVYDVKAYARFAGKSFSWKYIESPAIAKLLAGKIGVNTKIIEAGSGEGRLIEFLIKLGASEKNITAIELSNYLFNLGKEKFPKVRWWNASISDPIEGIKEGKNEIVICSMVLNYLSDEEFRLFLKNCNRWLGKNGEIIIVLPHPIRMVSSLPNYFKRVKGKHDNPWGGKEDLYYHRTVGDYVNEVIKAGFEVRELNELELAKEAIKEGGENVEKYSNGPRRLAIWAIKKNEHYYQNRG